MAKQANKFRNPLDGNPTLSQDFGKLNTDIGASSYHLGVDYAVPIGTQVYSVANGKIADTGENTYFGKYIITEHSLPNGVSIYSLYAHLSAVDVQKDKEIKIGEEIGKSGDTGDGGIHLHWEISYVNGFIGNGEFARGYDSKDEASFGGDLENGDKTVNPVKFVANNDTVQEVMKNFPPATKDTSPENVVPDTAKEKMSDVAKEKLDFSDRKEITINFDDILEADPFTDNNPISDGYKGLEWQNMFVLNASQAPGYQNSGYANGTISGDWVAFNAFGELSMLSDDSNFGLESGYFTAAWNNGLMLSISGYDDGVLVASEVLELNTQDPLLYVFGDEFSEVDKIAFETTGGQDAGLGGAGTHFALDDLVISVDEVVV